MLEHTRYENRTVLDASDEWSGTIDGHIVIVNRQDKNGFTEISIAPELFTQTRLPLLKFYPKYVSDLENLSSVLPNILSILAKELNSLGLNDLRTSSDKYIDEMYERIHTNKE